MDQEYLTYKLVRELLKQKAAHDSIVDALKKRIDDLERKCEDDSAEGFITHLFFTQKHPELIPEYVEMAYKEEPGVAKDAVKSFHDETLDLSTLDCTGDDFKPWKT